MNDVTQLRRIRIRLAVVAMGTATIGVAGYVGFVTVVGGGVGAGTLTLAAATGFAAFFSPCSFPLLLTFLAKRSESSARAALIGALTVGAGAVAFFALVALAIGTLGEVAGQIVAFDTVSGRVFRSIVGIFLIVLGLRNTRMLNLRILRLPVRWLDRLAHVASSRFDPAPARTIPRRDFVYGFGYLLAGFG